MTHALFLCRKCMTAWESYGYKRGECSSCSTPAELVYEEHPGDPISEFDNQRDKLRRYLGVKDPDMPKEEPMEELDFSPLQEVIEEQQRHIEALTDELDDYKASFATLEREKEDLEDKVTELENDIIVRNAALEQVGRLVSEYV